MKKILSLILVMFAIALPSFAKAPKDKTTKDPIEITTHPIDNSADSDRHRAPMRLNIEAYYDSETGSINICYDGEATGEVYLYLNGDIVDYSSEINSTFQLHTTGMYKIEIIGESWIAEGYLNL